MYSAQLWSLTNTLVKRPGKSKSSKWFHKCRIHHREYFGGQPLLAQWVYACKTTAICHILHKSDILDVLLTWWKWACFSLLLLKTWSVLICWSLTLTIHLLKWFVVIIRTRYWKWKVVKSSKNTWIHSHWFAHCAVWLPTFLYLEWIMCSYTTVLNKIKKILFALDGLLGCITHCYSLINLQ